MQKRKTRKMVTLALLSTISVVLMYLEFPLPFLPPFLKLDISSVPVMVGSFMYGPLAGVGIAAVKALIHLMFTQTAGVGELADFIITSSAAITAGVIYYWKKSRKSAFFASLSSIVVITIVGAVANYFIILPFYAKAFMSMETILEICQKVNPNITSVGTYILYAIVPFNVLKGTIIATVTFLIYKRISAWINQYQKKAE